MDTQNNEYKDPIEESSDANSLKNEEALKKHIRRINTIFALVMVISFLGVLYILNTYIPGGLKSIFSSKSVFEKKTEGVSDSSDSVFEIRNNEEIKEDQTQETKEDQTQETQEVVVEETLEPDITEPAPVEEEEKETPEKEPVYGEATLQLRGPTMSESNGKVIYSYLLNLNSIAAKRYADGMKYSFNMRACPSVLVNSSDTGFSGEITTPKIGDNKITIIVATEYLESKTDLTKVNFRLEDSEGKTLLSGPFSAPTCK